MPSRFQFVMSSTIQTVFSGSRALAAVENTKNLADKFGV